ncbi:MAG: transporter [bacterium]
MTTRKWLVAVSLLGLFAMTASAEWERTISAWDTRLPAQGKLQVSFWGNYVTWNDVGADANQLDGSIYANYGIVDNWSVCIAPSVTGWNVDGGKSEAGISDTALMTTYRFMDEADAGVDVAVMGRVSLPTGNEDLGLGSGNADPGVTVMASKDLGTIIVVANVNGRMIIDANDDEKDYTLSAELEGVCPLSKQLSLNVAFSAATPQWDSEDDNVDMGIGMRYKPQERIFVNGMVYSCLTDNYDWGFQAGAGYEF